MQVMADDGADPELRQVAAMAHATLLRIEQVTRGVMCEHVAGLLLHT